MSQLQVIWGEYGSNSENYFGVFTENTWNKFKGYLRYKRITSQNVSSEPQVKNLKFS